MGPFIAMDVPAVTKILSIGCIIILDIHNILTFTVYKFVQDTLVGQSHFIGMPMGLGANEMRGI